MSPRKFLSYYFRNLTAHTFFRNRISVGFDPENRVNFAYNISIDPTANRRLFRAMLRSEYPIIWLKEEFSEQLFTHADIKDYGHLLKTPITILTPEPERELISILKYGLQEHLFNVVLFDLHAINRTRSQKAVLKEIELCRTSINNFEEVLLSPKNVTA